MRGPLVRTLVAAAVLVASPVLVGGSSPSSAAEPVRILITGDSVTQGSSGDWTWRYWLWKHLASTSTHPVDLVGPRDDLWDELSNSYDNHDYADRDFDADHASRAGLSLAYPEVPMAELVETYQPDVVVEMLGVIDLTFWARTPEDTSQSVIRLISDARSANPDVSVVLGEVTQREFPGVLDFNARLHQIAAQLDQPDARVLVATADPAYTLENSTYDGSHPNAQGEVMIAASVADQLAELGAGAVPTRPLPVVPLGPRIPAVLSGTVAQGKVTLSWRRSPGAQTSQVRMRNLTTGGAWVVAADRVSGTTWSMPLRSGQRLQFVVLPRKGMHLAETDVVSNAVTVSMPQLPARPRPRLVRRVGKAVVTWPKAARADSYVVALREPGRKRWQVVASGRLRSRIVLRNMTAGRHYSVRVRARNTTGLGPWSRSVRFIAR